jgi:hypothetical protein
MSENALIWSPVIAAPAVALDAGSRKKAAITRWAAALFPPGRLIQTV